MQTPLDTLHIQDLRWSTIEDGETYRAERYPYEYTIYLTDEYCYLRVVVWDYDVSTSTRFTADYVPKLKQLAAVHAYTFGQIDERE